MVCNITSRKTASKGISGSGLVEVMISLAIGSMAMALLATVAFNCGRSFLVLGNYAELQRQNQSAVDLLTRDVRRSLSLSSYTSNSISLVDFDGKVLAYTYDPVKKTVIRSKEGEARVLLEGCTEIHFQISQRTPVGGSFEFYPTATTETCKVVDVSWNCGRAILGVLSASSEDVQTARIVIRKK